MKDWILKLVRKSVRLVVEEALVSAREELLKELEVSTMFSETEREQIKTATEMLLKKVLVELDKRI